jgi:alkylhydroperoxidase family enzyme
MARIPLVDPSSEGEPSRPATQHNVYRAVANHPRALQAFAAMGGFVYGETAITAAQRELAYLTASAVNNCHY